MIILSKFDQVRTDTRYAGFFFAQFILALLKLDKTEVESTFYFLPKKGVKTFFFKKEKKKAFNMTSKGVELRRFNQPYC